MFLSIISLLLVICMLSGITLGSAEIRLKEVIYTLFSSGGDYYQIIFNIRLPRVLTAGLAGMALSVSGAAMQGLLRNPLASPVSMGISHAAAFGAAFAIVVLGAGSVHSTANDAVMMHNPYLIAICAFAGSMLSTSVILLIARYKDTTPETIILSGIICGSLFTAGFSSLQYFANDVQLSAIVFWMFGDLGKANWNDFLILLAVVIPSFLYFMKNRWNHHALSAGDETAISLGVHVNRIRIRGMIIASLMTSVAVSFFGVIAFVGLVVPHIVRRFTGNDERFLIPSSAIFGGMFLLLSDIVARKIIAPQVLPVGILTSFIGTPLFIYLLIKGFKRY